MKKEYVCGWIEIARHWPKIHPDASNALLGTSRMESVFANQVSPSVPFSLRKVAAGAAQIRELSVKSMVCAKYRDNKP